MPRVLALTARPTWTGLRIGEIRFVLRLVTRRRGLPAIILAVPHGLVLFFSTLVVFLLAVFV